MPFPQHITAAFISAFLAIPLWMALDREPPYEITNGKAVLDTKTNVLTVTWDVKVIRACPPSLNSRVTRIITDRNGLPHALPITPATYNTNSTPPVIKNLIQLPDGIALPATYNAVPCYPCNPVQLLSPICMDLPAIPIEVKGQ